jgi:hypothetical protein
MSGWVGRWLAGWLAGRAVSLVYKRLWAAFVRGGLKKRVCRLRWVLVVRSMIQDGAMCWTNDFKMEDGLGYFVFQSKRN